MQARILCSKTLKQYIFYTVGPDCYADSNTVGMTGKRIEIDDFRVSGYVLLNPH